MFPVYFNDVDKELDFDDFQNTFLDICEGHRKGKRALLFAFILYDYKQAHIFKILEDKYYWTAMHEISAHFLTIFTIRQKEIINEDDAVFHYMTPAFFQNNPSKASDSLISRYFDKNLEITYPSILFFQVRNDIIVDSIIIKLKEQEIEKCYNELKLYIENVVEVLKGIEAPYNNNSKEIFNLVEMSLKSISAGGNILRVSKLFKNILGLIKIIKLFT